MHTVKTTTTTTTKITKKSCFKQPLKVTAFVCGCLSIILLIVSLSCTAWLETDGTRQGLWETCDRVGDEINCRSNDYKDWTIACAALCCIALLLALVATILTGVGLCTKDVVHKFKFYRVAMYFMFLAVVLMVISLIVFPVMFLKEIELLINTKWYFGWGYGVAWGATIFLLGAAILLLIDKETEEIFYREKTYYHHSSEDAYES